MRSTLAAAAGESYKIFHPDDVSIAHGLEERARSGGSLEPADLRLVRGDGYAWVRFYLEIERNAEGEPTRSVGLMLDIDQ